MEKSIIMLVAIISDVHDNIVNLKKVLDYCRGKSVRTMICCGDLAAPETLEFLKGNFSGEIHYVFGNAEKDRVSIFPESGEAEIAGKKIAFLHFPEKARELAGSGKYDFIFYGHTHKPWTEKIGGCELLNPGNVAGLLFLPTFAVWETESDKFELVRINELK